MAIMKYGSAAQHHLAAENYGITAECNSAKRFAFLETDSGDLSLFYFCIKEASQSMIMEGNQDFPVSVSRQSCRNDVSCWGGCKLDG